MKAGWPRRRSAGHRRAGPARVDHGVDDLAGELAGCGLVAGRPAAQHQHRPVVAVDRLQDGVGVLGGDLEGGVLAVEEPGGGELQRGVERIESAAGAPTISPERSSARKASGSMSWISSGARGALQGGDQRRCVDRGAGLATLGARIATGSVPSKTCGYSWKPSAARSRG